MAMLKENTTLGKNLRPFAQKITTPGKEKSTGIWRSRNRKSAEEKPSELTIAPGAVYDAVELLFSQSYVSGLSASPLWGLQECEDSMLRRMSWRRLHKLPLAPDAQKDKISILNQMQSILSAMRSEGTNLALVLVNEGGQNKLYFGACDNLRHSQAIEKFSTNFAGFTEGAELRPLAGVPYPAEVTHFSCAGTMTGIPSLKGEGSELVLQTMDKVARGVKGRNGLPKDFALIIRADAASAHEVDALERLLQDLENQFSVLASWEESVTDPTISTTTSKKGKTYEAAKNATILGAAGTAVMTLLPVALDMLAPGSGSALAGLFSAGASIAQGTLAISQPLMFATHGEGVSQTHNPGTHNVTRHYVDSRCQDALDMIRKHKERVRAGKGLGFWNVGVYVLGNDKDTVDTVLSTLQGAYAGNETYLNPIRTYNDGASRNSILLSYARNMELMPLPGRQYTDLGPLYSYLATPLTTKELSIECNLPRESHPGLEVSRSAVSYTANPPAATPDSICLGEVFNNGQPTGRTYHLDVNEFVQHAVLSGQSGAGKTWTVRSILSGLHAKGIPFLLIDPVKTDYLDWAIAYNHQLDISDPDYQKKRIHIYMPGQWQYDYWDMKTGRKITVDLDQFGINAFQPAVWGTPSTIRLEEHVSKLVDLLSGSMGMGNSLPALLRETITAYFTELYGPNAVSNEMPLQLFWHPDVRPDIAELSSRLETVIQNKSYSDEIKGNLRQCVKNCLDEVRQGWKAELLASTITWGMEELFDHPSVICLKGMGDDKDKAFAMSILMTWMRDYRESRFANDIGYRRAVSGKNVLRHLAVIEEAHVVMSKPTASLSTEDVNPGKKAAEISGALIREIRSYGQGLMIVDQTVSNLIDEVLSSTNVTMIHSAKSEEEAKRLADSIALDTRQREHLHYLQTGHLVIKDGRHQPCWVKVAFRDLQ